MLKDVFSACYANKKDEKNAYKSANENFHKLLSKYGLDDENHRNLFKDNNGWNEYNFNEKHIQLLKFIKEIDSVNPIDRDNVSSEKQSLEKFKKAANAIETIINSSEYPDISNVLQASLRTKEFLSLYHICDLVVKVVQLFQYACESEYVDFTIYDQVNKYLDTLLYTYVGNQNYKSMMLNEYNKISNIKLLIAQEYDGKLEFEPISIYNGFNSYINKIFDTVTKNKRDSLSIKIEDNQNFKYDFRYEFKNIEHIKEFLNIYYEYRSKSDNFREKNFSIMKTSYSKIAECFITLISQKIKILEYSDEKSMNIINSDYVIMGMNALDAVSEDLLDIDVDSNEEFLESLVELINIQNKLICKFAMNYTNGDLLLFFNFTQNLVKSLILEYQKYFEELIIDVYKFIFFDFSLNNVIYYENEIVVEKIVPVKISYKNFPIDLNELFTFKSVTGLSNEEIVDKIINALQNTENQIETDLKCDDELFAKIDNAVGIYLSNLFEKSQVTDPKKKHK